MMHRVNLIPAPRRAASQSRRRLHAWLLTLVGWTVAVTSVCIASRLSVGGDHVASAAELSSARERVGTLSTRLNELRRSLNKFQTDRDAALAISDHPDWSILLGLLSQATGEKIVLRDFSLKPDATASLVTLQVRGFAESQPAVSQFVLRLQQVGLFDEVKLVRTGREPIGTTSAVTFDITCTIRGERRPQP